MNYSGVSKDTINNMKRNGASQDEIEHARRTMNSTDVRDVVDHRRYIKQYNPNDQWRQTNNFLAHPGDYRFSENGPSSADAIGNLLSTLNQPVVMNTRRDLPEAIAPYVQFRYG